MRQLLICVALVASGCASSVPNGTDADLAADAAIAIDARPDAPPDAAIAYDVTGATSPGPRTLTVTFDAPPTATEATTAANYTIPGLAVTGTPTLSGDTVTLATADQTATTYTITVSHVTRATDHIPLTIDTATVTGTPVTAPTVIAVNVTSTLPDNGTQPYNTGTATLDLQGTEFTTVGCATGAIGVALDDLDGAGSAVGTHATSCSIVSNSELIATFPAGIRTNGATGWNVIVTNDAGANTISRTTFVPLAGLVISEVYTGTSGATDHEFLEVYNRTATPIDRTNLHLHVRSSTGVDADKTLTAITTTAVPAHGFLLFASSVSAAPDAWAAHADVTYSAALVGNGGAYLSLSATANALVIDKAGWGTQAAPGFEGTALADIPSNDSAERKPASGLGATTDTDNNAADFNAPSTAITPRGTIDGIQPGPTFNVIGAVATSTTAVAVTFDAPPAAAAATTIASYTIAGLAVTAATLSGNTVTLTTAAQTATSYTVTVAGVTRAFDATPLTTATATFTGRAAFAVASAMATSPVAVTVTFTDPPDPTAAVVLANYSIPGLTLTGTPTLSGAVITLATSAQLATAYTVTVSGVARASDGEALTTATATFTGIAVQIATVTAVTVTTNTADSTATAWNTGMTTVTLTGTDFDTVMCPAGVALDDLDGSGSAVGTAGTCTAVSGTQLTVTFPAGIRTNGATGWDVLVTNNAGTNTTSAAKYVPRAGLLLSELYVGTSGNSDDEYIEVYNPTAATFDPTLLHLHVRGGTGTDGNKPLTAVTTALIPAHGFYLMVSSVAAMGDAWFAHRDATYTAGLVANGGAYLSLSATANANVLDKCGWGTQPAPGYEGSAATNIPASESSERLPAGGHGDATDTDDNAADFTAPSTVLTPMGTADPAQE